MIRRDFRTGVSRFSTWESVFENGSDIGLSILDTGVTTIPVAGAVKTRGNGASCFSGKSMSIPVYSFLVNYGESYTFLIDAGLDSSFQVRPYGRLKGFLKKAIIGPSSQQPGQNVASRLTARGASADMIFFTHLHFDHVAGIADMPDSPQLIVGKSASFPEAKPFFFGNYISRRTLVYEIDCREGVEMPVFGKCTDIFGDGSFWAIPTPGHAPGHLSYLINGKEGAYFVFGDSFLVRESFEESFAPGFYFGDKKLAAVTQERIRSFLTAFPDVVPVFSHSEPIQSTVG